MGTLLLVGSSVATFFLGAVALVIHELGHYATALLVRSRIDSICIGAGDVLFDTWIGSTSLTVRRMPIGGHVWAFLIGTRWARIRSALVYAGGPLANFALAAIAVVFLLNRSVDDVYGTSLAFLLWFLVFTNGLVGLVNLLPKWEGTRPRDGLGILLSLRGYHLATLSTDPDQNLAAEYIACGRLNTALHRVLDEHGLEAALQSASAQLDSGSTISPRVSGYLGQQIAWLHAMIGGPDHLEATLEWRNQFPVGPHLDLIVNMIDAVLDHRLHDRPERAARSLRTLRTRHAFGTFDHRTEACLLGFESLAEIAAGNLRQAGRLVKQCTTADPRCALLPRVRRALRAARSLGATER